MNGFHYVPQITETNLAAVLSEWNNAYPGMGVLALVPESEKNAVPLLQEVCNRDDIQLVGAIFPEIIHEGHFRKSGCWLMRFDEAPFYLLRGNLPVDVDGLLRASDEISAQIYSRLRNREGDATLMLVFDAMVPNIASYLDQIYLKLADRVHYAGSNAGSETFQPMPCLFDGNHLIEGGVLAILMERHSGAILEHGYEMPEQTHTATSTEGNKISLIDWKPAFDVYCALVKKQYGVDITRDNFYQYAVHFPFGIARANHCVLVRIPVALGDDGSLFCVGEVPPHSMLTLLQSPSQGSRQTVSALIENMNHLNGDIAGRDMLLFYCAGRRMHLGLESAEAEMQDLVARSGVAGMAGALSLGEIGATTVSGYPLFHNATLVAALW